MHSAFARFVPPEPDDDTVVRPVRRVEHQPRTEPPASDLAYNRHSTTLDPHVVRRDAFDPKPIRVEGDGHQRHAGVQPADTSASPSDLHRICAEAVRWPDGRGILAPPVPIETEEAHRPTLPVTGHSRAPLRRLWVTCARSPMRAALVIPPSNRSAGGGHTARSAGHSPPARSGTGRASAAVSVRPSPVLIDSGKHFNQPRVVSPDKPTDPVPRVGVHPSDRCSRSRAAADRGPRFDAPLPGRAAERESSRPAGDRPRTEPPSYGDPHASPHSARSSHPAPDGRSRPPAAMPDRRRPRSAGEGRLYLGGNGG